MPKDCDDTWIRYVVRKCLPMDFFEDEASIEFFTSLNEDVVLPTSYDLCIGILKKIDDTKSRIKNILSNNSSKVSISLNIFTHSGYSFCGVTCHFVDSDWKLQSVVLDFMPMHEKQEKDEFADQLNDMLKSFEIDGKIQAVVWNTSVESTEFFKHYEVFRRKRFLCFSDLLRRGAEAILEVLQCEEDAYNPAYKLKQLLTKLRESQELQISFNNCCDDAQLNPSMPRNDMGTVWESNLEEINWVLTFKTALTLLWNRNDDVYEFRIDNKNWKWVGDAVNYLKPFKTLNELFSAEKYCPLSTTVLGMNMLLDKLEKWVAAYDCGPFDTALIKAHFEISDNYDQSNALFCVSLILDPRHKKETFRNIASGKNLEKIAFEKFQNMLKSDYCIDHENLDGSNGNLTTNKSDEYDISFSDIFLQSTEASTSESYSAEQKLDNELEAYLLTKRASEDTDILLWWRSHVNTFPTLAKMARDLFCVVTTCQQSEKVFSTKAEMMFKNHTFINPDLVRNVVRLNCWFDYFSD